MVRNFLILCLLSTLSIFITALPTRSSHILGPLSQQSLSSTLPPLPHTKLQNSNQKLCGVPFLYLYPCTWSTSPSISPLEKLGPVIFVKYIINIPSTLLDSILTPLTALQERDEGRPSYRSPPNRPRTSVTDVQEESEGGHLQKLPPFIAVPALLFPVRSDRSSIPLSSIAALPPQQPNIKQRDIQVAFQPTQKADQRIRVRWLAGEVTTDAAIINTRSGADDTVLYNDGEWTCDQGNGSLKCVESTSSSGRLATPALFRLPALFIGFLGQLPRCLVSALDTRDFETPKRDIHCQGGGDEPFHGCVESGASSLGIPKLFLGPYLVCKVFFALPKTLAPSIARTILKPNQHNTHLSTLLHPQTRTIINTTLPKSNIEDLAGENLTGETIKPGIASIKYFYRRWNLTAPEPPTPALVKQCTANVPSKEKHFHLVVATSSARPSRSVPRIFAVPMILLRSVKAIPLSWQAVTSSSRYRSVSTRRRSTPLQLEDLNGTTATPSLTGAKDLCFWGFWRYSCSGEIPMPYRHCVLDVPSKSDTERTYDCTQYVIPSAAQISRSIPRLFTVPVMLLKAVHAIPLSRPRTRTVPGSESHGQRRERRSDPTPLELENLDSTTAIPNPTVSKELCWFGIWAISCSLLNKPSPVPTRPPKPKQKCQIDGYTHHITCVDLPSAARSAVAVPSIFVWPVVLFKVVSGRATAASTMGSRREIEHPNLKSEGTAKAIQETRRTIIAKAQNHLRDLFTPPVSVARAISQIPRNIASTFSTWIDSQSKNTQGGGARVTKRSQPCGHQTFDASCVHSFPSASSLSLTAPRPFRLLAILFSLHSRLPSTVDAIPFPPPAAITNPIADPNFDLLRKSVAEIIVGARKWLGARGFVDARYGARDTLTEAVDRADQVAGVSSRDASGRICRV